MGPPFHHQSVGGVRGLRHTRQQREAAHPHPGCLHLPSTHLADILEELGLSAAALVPHILQAGRWRRHKAQRLGDPVHERARCAHAADLACPCSLRLFVSSCRRTACVPNPSTPHAPAGRAPPHLARRLCPLLVVEQLHQPGQRHKQGGPCVWGPHRRQVALADLEGVPEALVQLRYLRYSCGTPRGGSMAGDGTWRLDCRLCVHPCRQPGLR